jgi:hypothetical protein
MADMKHSHYRVKEFGPNSTKIVFFFTILNTRLWLYWWPIRKLTKNGFKVIAYDYSGRLVLNGDVQKFLDVSHAIQSDVASRIRVYKVSGATDFYAFGSSMGTIFTIMCAANIREISKVVINLTYGSLAEHVWSWRYLRRSKRMLMREGITMERLEEMVTLISPIPNAAKLKGKEVLLYLARRDKVLPSSQSSKFKAALDKANVSYQYHESRWLGHVASIIANLWRWRIYTDFLRAKH